jgi:hypothetical protein
MKRGGSRLPHPPPQVGIGLPLKPVAFLQRMLLQNASNQLSKVHQSTV